MSYTSALTRPFVRLYDWYRRPDPFIHAVTGCTVLDVLPASRDRDTCAAVISRLIDEGTTPATSRDVAVAYRAVTGRAPSPTEAAAARTYVASFGLLA